MKPFLKNIADELLKLPVSSVQQTLVVLPSRRASVFLKHYIAQELKQPIWLPKLISIEDFIAEQSGLQLADNLLLQFKLYEVYTEFVNKDEADSLDQFLQWSQTLLYDFNEIDRYLVNAKQLLTNLSGLKELEQWSLNEPDLTPFQEQYIRFFEHIYVWYSHFRQKLLAEGLAYQGMAYRQAAEHIHLKEIPYQEIWFVGLNALTAAEKHIINHLKANQKAKLFWDADKHYFNNEEHEAGLFLRKHQANWGGIKPQELLTEAKKLRFIGCAKNVGQSRVAGQIMSTFKKDEVEKGEVALVLADEQLLFPVLNNLPEIDTLNITMGAPLSSTPLFTLVDCILRMQLRYQQYQRGGFYYRDVQKLLRHPYSAYLFETVQLQSVLEKVKTNNLIFIDASQFDLSDDLLREFLTSWDSEGLLQIMQAMIDRLKESLITEKASLASEVLFQFQKNLKQLGNYLEESQQDWSLKTLKSVFYQIIGKESIPFRGEPLRGLQLMGLLETRTLDFKKLIILSVNEGKLPAGKSSNSFIPFVLKKYFKMPTHEERDAVFAYHFYRLLQRVEEAHLIYNTQNDDFGSGEPSRFITQIKAELAQLDMRQQLLSSDLSELVDNTITIHKTEAVKKSIEEWAQQKVSPSSLNTYIACPLQFYYRYIAGVRKEEEVEEFMDSSTLGSAIHDALEKGYHAFQDQRLSLVEIEKIRTKSLESLDAILKNKFKKRLGQGKNHLLHQVAKQMCHNFIDAEKEVIESGAELQLKGLEETLQHTLLLSGIKVQLYGKVDRIDQLNEQWRIIDYKTGKVEATDLGIASWDELITNSNKSKAFQLMMYAYLYLKNNSDIRNAWAGNFSFKNQKEGLLCLKAKGARNPLTIKKEELQLFENQLEQLVLSIFDEKQPFIQTQKLSTCSFCDFKAICGR